MTARPTEELHPDAAGLQDRNDAAVLATILDAQLAAATTVRAAIPSISETADLAAHALRNSGRVAYVGAGSSGLMALADALELPGTFSIPAESAPVLFAGGAEALIAMAGSVEDDENAAIADCDQLGFRNGDVAICVSVSGRTPYTVAIAERARKAGADTVAFVNVPGSPLEKLANVTVLLDTRAELVAGSTRMGAGTAQKIALNMFSTLVGMRLGHVYEGYMVNLTADNSKLRARASKIVGTLAAVSDDVAEAALRTTEGSVKHSVLIAAGAANNKTAQKILEQNDGRLGPALEALRNSNDTHRSANGHQ